MNRLQFNHHLSWKFSNGKIILSHIENDNIWSYQAVENISSIFSDNFKKFENNKLQNVGIIEKETQL